jgi:hypothetical protein
MKNSHNNMHMEIIIELCIFFVLLKIPLKLQQNSMFYGNAIKIYGFLLQSIYNHFYFPKIMYLKSLSLNPLSWVVQNHIIMIQNQLEFKIQTNNVPWVIPILNVLLIQTVAPLLWPSVGVKPNTWKKWDLESSGTPECSELGNKGQNTSHWGVLGVIGKVFKRRYRKCPRIGNSDICSSSYGQKKGWESN